MSDWQSRQTGCSDVDQLPLVRVNRLFLGVFSAEIDSDCGCCHVLPETRRLAVRNAADDPAPIVVFRRCPNQGELGVEHPAPALDAGSESDSLASSAAE